MAAAAATAAAAGDDKRTDFYGVLGLEKEFTAQELRNAYKRLALRWHPDRCSGSTRSVEEAKKKFQDIQEAYSDSNKRFLYDVGVYENDDEEESMQEMGDFLSEMAAMMSQTKPSENGEDSFERLQEMFDEMFQSDVNWSNASQFDFNSSDSSSPSSFYNSLFNNNHDNISHPAQNGHSADYSNMGSVNTFDAQFPHFCFGPGGSSSGSWCNSEKIKGRTSRRPRTHKVNRSSQRGKVKTSPILSSNIA